MKPADPESAVPSRAPTLLRRLIRMIKRSPVLTRTAWRLYQTFPALGRIVAQRAVRSAPVQRCSAPVLIVPPSAWDDTVSSAAIFRQQLRHAAHRDRQPGEGGQR